MEFKEYFDLQNKKLIDLYNENFPPEERIDINTMFSGVFKNFKLYVLYNDKSLVGMAHFNETRNFIHLNYLAIKKEHQNMGYGSYIISQLKNMHNNKTIVADIEEPSILADNNEYRLLRRKFYKKNGFNEGIYTFMWEGVLMTYYHTEKINHDEFMKYIQVIFPTIMDVKKR